MKKILILLSLNYLCIISLYSQAENPFVRYAYGTELLQIINLEGNPGYIEDYGIGHIYYNKLIEGYYFNIEYRIVNNRLIATHYHLIISENSIEKYVEIFYSFINKYNVAFGEARIIEADYLNFISYHALWKVDIEPSNFTNGFIKITMFIPNNNNIEELIIYISHLRYAM